MATVEGMAEENIVPHEFVENKEGKIEENLESKEDKFNEGIELENANTILTVIEELSEDNFISAEDLQIDTKVASFCSIDNCFMVKEEEVDPALEKSCNVSHQIAEEEVDQSLNVSKSRSRNNTLCDKSEKDDSLDTSERRFSYYTKDQQDLSLEQFLDTSRNSINSRQERRDTFFIIEKFGKEKKDSPTTRKHSLNISKETRTSKDSFRTDRNLSHSSIDTSFLLATHNDVMISDVTVMKGEDDLTISRSRSDVTMPHSENDVTMATNSSDNSSLLIDISSTEEDSDETSSKIVMVRNAKDVYDLQCRICLLNYKNPRVLPCLHSFCHTCLEDTINVDERSFNCPVCHLVLPIPTKGADAFPLNSFASNMLNILAVENPNNCTNCEDRELASSRCLDCVENLCESCVTAHERIRQTKSHRIVTFGELQNNTVDDSIRCPSFCKIHDREILKYFCESCDAAICRDCAIFEHREHNYLDLREAVKQHGKQLTDLLMNTRKKIPILKQALDSILRVESDLKQREEEISELINESINKHIRLLEERRKTLLLHAHRMTEKKNFVLQEQFRRLNFTLDNISSSCEFVDNVTMYGNEAEFMDVKYFMLSRLHKLNEHKSQLVPEENDVLDFDQKSDKMRSVIHGFGVLSTSEAFAPYCTACSDNEAVSKIGYSSTFNVILKDRTGERLNKGGDNVTANFTDGKGDIIPIDVIDNQNGSYTIKYNVKSKTVHSLAVCLRDKPIRGSPFLIEVSTGIDMLRIGPLLTRFGSCGVESSTKLNETYEPWGICCDNDDNIIVTDHSNHKIQIFDKNGKLLRHFGSRGKNDGEVWYPTGVTLDHGNNIFVADHGNHRIQVFTHEGKFIRKFCTRGNSDGQLKGPCGIAIDHSDRLIVADRDNHRVQILSNEGKFLSSIGSYGNGEGKFDSPRHVAIALNNDILVSDSNNGRVQRFDSNGEFVGILGKKGSDSGQFQCPAGICTDTEDNLVVADFKNLDLQIFDKKGVYMKKIGVEKSFGNLFSKPTSVCVTKSGNIFVTDRGTHKISLF